MAVVKFNSATLAEQVASNLRGVIIDEDCLTFLAFDEPAFEFSVSFEKLSRTDYSFVDSLEIKFFTDNLFHSFVLHIESTHRHACPSSLAPESIPIVSVSFAVRLNTQFFQFLEFVKSVSDRDIIMHIQAAVVGMVTRPIQEAEVGTVTKGNVATEYSLTLFGGNKREAIIFSPYKFSSRTYN